MYVDGRCIAKLINHLLYGRVLAVSQEVLVLVMDSKMSLYDVRVVEGVGKMG